jgi:hypothetical protein
MTVSSNYSSQDYTQIYSQMENQAVSDYAKTEKDAEQQIKAQNDQLNAEDLQGS